MIFKYLPDVKIPFRVVWFGAILTALLFTIGKYGLAIYLGRASTSSTYGAAGSVILIMMWVYYASIILLYGVEFTHAYAKVTGTEVVPDKYAVPITAEERAQQGVDGKKEGGSALRKKPRAPQPEHRQHGGEESARKPVAVATAMVADQEKKIARETVVDRTDWLGAYRPKEYVPVLVAAGLVGGLLLRNRLLRRGVQMLVESR
jgi:hypothetical protein